MSIMAENRRSGRTKKQIDYSKFSGDGSDDDDFRDSASPPTKKRKEKKSSELSSNQKTTSAVQVDTSSKQVNGEEQKPKARLSVSEKVFQRNIEAALELSKSVDVAKTVHNRDDDFQSNISKVVNVKLTRIPEITEKKEKLHSTLEYKSDSSSKDEETKVKPKAKGSQVKLQEVSDSSSDYQSDASEEKTKPKTKVKTSYKLPAPQKKCTPLKKSIQFSSAKPKIAQVESVPFKMSSIKSNKICIIPSMGLRLGLSRKAAVKSLHPVLQK